MSTTAAGAQVAQALAANRYDVLASLARTRLSVPAELDSSAPLFSKALSIMNTTVSFDPSGGIFTASVNEGGRARRIFQGASLNLACASANQALYDAQQRSYKPTKTPLPGVSFARAIARLAQLAAP
jgi:hypothetical protein